MSDSNDFPLAQWKLLRLENKVSSNEETLTLPSAVETGFGKVRYALSKSSEARILIPLTGNYNSLVELSTKVLSINLIRFQLHGKFSRYADITCHSSHLDSVFSDVVIELLNRIKQGKNSSEAISGTISDFKALLSPPASEISLEVVVGLLGELALLERLLSIDPLAWKAWRGPLSERYDFRAGDFAIEVKSSKQISSPLVSIASIDQLEAPKNGQLFINHIIFEEVANGSISVSKLVNRILEMSSNSQDIYEKLKKIGYNSSNIEQWDRYKFCIHQTCFYAVDEKFPKITRNEFTQGHVPNGIGSINYEIDLRLASNSKLEFNEQILILRKLISCLTR